MKILIVEDETAAYENLADMILSLDSSIEIMGNTCLLYTSDTADE